jgi:hypothetical protein
MGTPSAKPIHRDPFGGVERRGAERLRVKGLWCDKGQIIDLSKSGMRIRVLRRWHEGQTRSITIVDDHDSAPVEARCVWCRQEGLFAHVVGLAFDGLTPEGAAALEAIAERNRAPELGGGGAG